ncbi:arsenic resistance protein [Jeotgalibacillus salarius]|uniref:Arsenic resistance protein n=1 Tax=Jeotgalibacillus salarius TaxID=546023 RepID=A0A4Y8LIU1_9BACL|nr:arsenic resistance protein [Jeotgalibacillus salarius]TFE00491.1 arsenic resistance protein [Jeotgalibacillus salarius]
MSQFEKLYSFFIIGAVALGLLLSQSTEISPYTEKAILPLLAFMIYITFLQIPFKDLKASFQNKTFSLASLLINFVWTPVFAWLLTMVFLPDQPALAIGLMMLLVTPCTDWYLIFTGIAKGNTALATAILPLNLILQIILLPVYLFIFFGASETVDAAYLAEGVLWVLIIPFVMAQLTMVLVKKKSLLSSSTVQNLPTVLLLLAIIAMFAAQGNSLFEHAGILVNILPALVIFFIVNFFISQKTGRLCKLPAKDRVSLTMTTMARNSPLALAIAVAAFPSEPLIALTLVIGPLIELPVLALITKVLLKLSSRN